MPGFNQTGPMGQGSMTGRRMGKCTNFGAQGQEQTSTDAQDNTQNLSQGFGRGGMGRGMVVEWLADLLEVAEWVVAEVAAIAVVADPLIKMNRGCKSPLFINICRKNINTKVSLDV